MSKQCTDKHSLFFPTFNSTTFIPIEVAHVSENTGSESSSFFPVTYESVINCGAFPVYVTAKD